MEFGVGVELLLFVIFLDTSKPVLNPSSKVCCKVNVPLDAPIDVSFCFDLSGTKASIWSLNFNLLPDWEAKWTVGVQKPETQIQSQSIVSDVSNPVLSLFNFPICQVLIFV